MYDEQTTKKSKNLMTMHIGTYLPIGNKIIKSLKNPWNNDDHQSPNSLIKIIAMNHLDHFSLNKQKTFHNGDPKKNLFSWVWRFDFK